MTFNYEEEYEEQSTSFELIPAGTLSLCEISNIEEQTSKSGKEMLKVELTLLEGDHGGRKVWDYIVEPQVAGEWGWNKIKSILSVSNKAKPAASRFKLSSYLELQNKICAIEVGISKKTADYEPNNTVRAYLRNNPTSQTYDKYKKLTGGGRAKKKTAVSEENDEDSSMPF